ncbi:MAG: YggS family pyridoxal phosphate-dependent enzyme [Propionibacteriaceae bacterium]|jgi:pyridoxal phosphate enzyme (YggS family)|nr:YggS family pyridoxal phosphate-dependent enzyme [Propionibacteriaceae bacterium]
MAVIAENLAQIRARMDAACARVGRDPRSVRLLPVSKTRTPAEIRAAYAAGCRRFGENRAQEAAAKAGELADLDIAWVIIGHLQSNKAKLVAGFAAELQSLDSEPLAAQLDARLQAAGRSMDVLIQVNTSGETTKSGLHPNEVLAFARRLTPFQSLRVKGLMTIALPAADPNLIAPCFETMRRLQRELREAAIEGQSYEELSMGMTGDFELAIAHGSTQVRVGTAIFGPRPLTEKP